MIPFALHDRLTKAYLANTCFGISGRTAAGK